MEETPMPISEWKKTIWKGYMLYDLNYVTFWKMQKKMETVKRTVVAKD